LFRNYVAELQRSPISEVPASTNARIASSFDQVASKIVRTSELPMDSEALTIAEGAPEYLSY
jgi:hypothetical protein